MEVDFRAPVYATDTSPTVNLTDSGRAGHMTKDEIFHVQIYAHALLPIVWLYGGVEPRDIEFRQYSVTELWKLIGW
jgi:hypothetical protein